MISPDIAATARNLDESLQPSAIVMIAPLLKPVAKMRDWSTQSCDSKREIIAST